MKRIVTAALTGWTIAAQAAGIALPQSFRAHFVQTVTSPEKATIRYEGDVFFTKPSRLKWVYTQPARKEVCTDGRDLSVVDHELEQVSRYRLAKHFDLAAVLARAKPLRDRIYTAEFEGKTYTLRLDSAGNLDSVAYYDDNDNKIQLLFTDIRRLTKPLPLETMRCDYPVSYDVIEG